MGEEEHWAAEILSADRETVSHYCPVIIPWPLLGQKLPVGMKGKSFLHDLCWGLAALPSLWQSTTRGLVLSPAKQGMRAGSHGGSKDTNWEMWWFPAPASHCLSAGWVIGSLLSPPPGGVSGLVGVFNLGKKNIRIFPCVIEWMSSSLDCGKVVGSEARRRL